MNWDPYAALGVARTASPDDIRRAYRKLAKELHPDVRPGDKQAEERFKRATAAFNLLSDAKLKARFDRGEIDADGNERTTYSYRGGPGAARARGYTSAGAGADSAFDLGDIFSDLFGSAAAAGARSSSNFARMRGRDLRVSTEIDFVDAVRGAKRRVTLSDGRSLEVTIPPGVSDGQVLRLKSQGAPGVQGGPPGDAMVELKIKPHPLFRREGDDVHMDLPISIVEAIEGARVQVPTASGPVTLAIPEGANSGKVLRLKGKGVGDRGDQFVRLIVMLPETGDDALRKFVKSWARRDYTPNRPNG